MPQGDLAKIHKDFYLNHPDLSLQCERFCWGNLEAAHPVLGQRSQEEAEEYRKANGIVVQVVRGRSIPRWGVWLVRWIRHHLGFPASASGPNLSEVEDLVGFPAG